MLGITVSKKNMGRFIVFVSFCLLLSCQDANNLTDKSKVFRYNQPNSITSLDPAFAKSQNNMWAINHIFNGLVRLDDSLNIVPCIAKSWTISNDGFVYTFTLRDDVLFHKNQCFKNKDSTRILTASDVAYSLSRLVDPKVNSPGSWLFSDKVDGLESFKAPNDSTFVLVLNRPFIPTLGILTMQYCSILPREAVESYKGDFRSYPVGTGPYQLKRWIENEVLFLERNKLYFDHSYWHEDAPQFIKTTFIPDKQIAALELLNNKLDLVAGLESSFINEFLDKEGRLRKEKQDKIRYIRSPYLNTEYIGINLEMAKTHNGLKLKKFRQALNFAIDKKLMLQALRNSVGSPANSGITPRGLPSFDEEKIIGYSFDIAKAKALMLECGFDNPNKVQPLFLHTNNEYLDLATYVAKQWEKLGLKVVIELMDTAVLRDGMRKASIPLFRASWIADYPEAESYFCIFYSKNPAPPNYTRFSNAEYDKLYEEAVKENDTAKRYELYHKMERLIIDEAPVIFLFYDESSVFINKNVNGFVNNGLNILNLDRIWKTKI